MNQIRKIHRKANWCDHNSYTVYFYEQLCKLWLEKRINRIIRIMKPIEPEQQVLTMAQVKRMYYLNNKERISQKRKERYQKEKKTKLMKVAY